LPNNEAHAHSNAKAGRDPSLRWGARTQEPSQMAQQAVRHESKAAVEVQREPWDRKPISKESLHFLNFDGKRK